MKLKIDDAVKIYLRKRMGNPSTPCHLEDKLLNRPLINVDDQDDNLLYRSCVKQSFYASDDVIYILGDGWMCAHLHADTCNHQEPV